MGNAAVFNSESICDYARSGNNLLRRGARGDAHAGEPLLCMISPSWTATTEYPSHVTQADLNRELTASLIRIWAGRCRRNSKCNRLPGAVHSTKDHFFSLLDKSRNLLLPDDFQLAKNSYIDKQMIARRNPGPWPSGCHSFKYRSSDKKQFLKSPHVSFVY